jgi:hypothetical protein
MVCFYAGKPSQYLQLPNGNFRFRDDGFELNRASENPLIEDQQGKKDWAQSNKCVGFNVDIGIRNQNIFYSFSVSQDNGVATSETINTYLNMVNQATGRNTATQNVSLYNLYKNRSYKCTVTSLGNALLQPTMYFNLRHVPMFNGPYMIQDVQHTIQPGNFQTTFTGVRQGIFDLSQIDSYIQSMNQNLLTRLEEVLKISKDDVVIPVTSNNEKSSNIVQTANNTLDTSNSCVSNVDTSVYVGYENIAGSLITLNPEILKTKLQEIIPNNVDLQVLVFCITYVTSYQLNNKKNGEFKGWDNNYALISLYYNYGAAGQTHFKKSYSCVNVKASKPKGNSLPIVSFKDIDSYLEFMKARLEKNVDRALKLTYPKYYSCYWPNNGANGEVSESYYDSHIDEFKTVVDSMYKAIDLAKTVKLISDDKVKQLKGKINEEKSKQTGPTVTPTPSPIPPQPGQTCPPPVIISFSPMTGGTGTIVQINGKNLINTTGITVNNISVDMKQTTIYNDTTIRFTIPTLYGIVTTANVPIQVKGGYGNTTSNIEFKYLPQKNIIPNSNTSLTDNTFVSNTPPQKTNTDVTIFSNSVLLNQYLFKISLTPDNKISGSLGITSGRLSEAYNATLYVSSLEKGSSAKIKVANFTINGSAIDNGANFSLGKFTSTTNDWRSDLNILAGNQRLLLFTIVIDQYLQYTYTTIRASLPYPCPELEINDLDLINLGDYKVINENPCKECYPNGTSGTNIIINGKTC